MVVARWDPVRDMVSLREAMDRLFEDAFVQTPANGVRRGGWTQGIPVDVYHNDSEVVVKATLPGIKPEDLELTVERGHLIIKGEVKTEEQDNGNIYLHRERSAGVFGRIIALPAPVDDANIEAKLENGVLVVRLPKSELARPKQIKVQAN